jgi:transglutaminase-like putative cysteine protease
MNEFSSDFLSPTPFCNSQAPEIVEKARELVGKKTGREAAEALFNWVRENVEYRVIGLESANKTLRRRKGCCLNKSNLLIALARSVKLPARYLLFDCRLHSPNLELAAQRLQHIVPEIHCADVWLAGDPAYESALSEVYEIGVLGKTTWLDVRREERRAALPYWLWPAQRLIIWISPGAWKVRRATGACRRNKN